MAIFKDTEDFTIRLTEKNTDWYSLLQFCVCKVNPRYYKNIRIKQDLNDKRYTLYWESLNDSHLWCYPFPSKVTKETIEKLKENLPPYITVIL